MTLFSLEQNKVIAMELGVFDQLPGVMNEHLKNSFVCHPICGTFKNIMHNNRK